ncbi:uroporphyrinogen-III C-methyltransferase [Marinoscillum furvescens]|uniref:uroporphyrinogen-III C-methyltransferase n=1 Tax=Marinoscillum furvescens DSM 4134 TaxID=1122208 RepID=A0A3D9LG03_MARFU|nr:uroporphyrinogen-III C-methyltransferase [Marinoscillum furvescens]REE05600.1 uroporphyrin-III C-methyltransferase [Marinoscillum furvescens DSM 4134]
MSRLIVVGAGPGDPELITLKAVSALKSADVVLYDALANEELLDICAPYCEKIYVGKKCGLHQFQQVLINDMIVDYGKKYDTVVRLKGGDPFVFGRGYEELAHAKSHGMEVEVVPGITSALAVPALSQIPATSRGVSTSFWVMTGTTTSLEVSDDLRIAARSQATLVILMGMRQLNTIVERVADVRGQDEPVAIIQNGTLPEERSVWGTLATIQDQVEKETIGSPAIIVIGEVVKLGKGVLGELSAVISASGN